MSDYSKYDDLKRQVLELMAEGRLPERPTREQRIDIVYGNCKLSNPDVTREMVERAVFNQEMDALERKRVARQHWPDCALNHGGTECDMGPECGEHCPDGPHCGCDLHREGCVE